MRVLLDTCTFLWISSGSTQLSALARQTFVDPANEVFLSVVSAWEVSVKHGLGKLPLPVPPDRFVPEQRNQHTIDSLSLDETSVLQLAKLPSRHRDPFDRMLVCQAIAHGLTILTPDPLITQYPVLTRW